MRKYIAIICAALVVSSCSLDENISPNNVLADQLSPELRLSAAQTSAYVPFATTMNGLGNIWTNAWAGNVAQFGNPLITESTLDISTSFRQSIWNSTYQTVARFQAIIDVENPEEYPNYIAISKILKAFYLQYMVDLYGDVPYSEAFNSEEDMYPKYDNDVDVYAGLVGEINEAITLIEQTQASANPDIYAVPGSSDVIYGGDMDKWLKFANTLLLKYAIHLSETTDPQGSDLRNAILSDLVNRNATYITEDATINPGYNNSASSKQNPLYNSFGRGTSSGTVNVQGYMLMTASKHIIVNLLGTDTGMATYGVEDPRIGDMFTSAQIYNGNNPSTVTGYDGFTQGDTSNDFKVSHGFPATAQNPTNDNVSLLGGIFYSFPDGASTDGYLIMLSEAEFLQAEAALRGYPGFSNAAAHFEAGIQASFDFYQNPDGGTYLSDISGKPQVGWAGSNQDKLAAIQYQRWIALTNFNGIECFVNYLRTGYPVTPLATTANHPNKPYRLLYPAREYSANSANVPNISLGEVFAINEFTPFIYK